MKDFSWDPAGGFAPEDRGRYSALCRTGTTLNGDGIHPTDIDYVKSLGVTHIQLMPVYDYGSGCGSELATERSMCAKYILDSVLYWTEELHMDGFRFDLMGLMDTEMMNRIQHALDQRYGVGEKLIYGEPWGVAESAVRPGTELGHKGNLKKLDPRIAAFCDSTRDAVKGGLMNEGNVGFVNGSFMAAGQLRRCIADLADGEHAQVQAPSQTITYLSCHDDWTLWGKLVCTMDGQRRFEPLQPHILRANRLAAAINFCCQVHPFLLSGEEFAHTKGDVKNSHCSSPEINCLDWTRAYKAGNLVELLPGDHRSVPAAAHASGQVPEGFRAHSHRRGPGPRLRPHSGPHHRI